MSVQNKSKRDELDAEVLRQSTEQTLELRRYFSMVAARATTAASENGFALVTDEQLEQAALVREVAPEEA